MTRPVLIVVCTLNCQLDRRLFSSAPTGSSVCSKTFRKSLTGVHGTDAKLPVGSGTSSR